MTKPLLTIICITYNHERFIAQAIEGFLMQKTCFPIEIIIHDDCSTDNTKEIIQEYVDKYPELIKPTYQKENQYSLGKKITPIVLPYSKGKYIAFCEGDDYWTDPNKLQKQVDFLEGNPEYVLCWTRFNTLNNESGKLCIDNNSNYFHGNEGIDFNFEIFAKGWHIGMQTLVYRRDSLIKNNHFENEYYKDVFLISDLLTMGKGYCLNEAMAIYRLHEGGIYSLTSEISKAKIGALTYREIFKVYSNNTYLKSKYLNFNKSYITCLIKNRLYNKALYTLDDQINLVAESRDYKNDLFRHIEKELLIPAYQQIKQNEKQLKQKDGQLNDIYHSLSFKIGRSITFPIRLAHSLQNISKDKIELFLNKNKRELKDMGVVFIDKRKIIKDSKTLKPLPSQNRGTPKLIVSLTSFPERIPEIFFNLYSLLNQTIQPDMLILWLADEQFPNREKDLPKRVLKLQDSGLSIRWCKDIKSYKKLLFALKEYPNDIIVTADDDLYYKENWLELLYNSYLREPQYIHCHRAHKITFGDNDMLNSYKDWPKCIKTNKVSFLNFCTTGGGVLYPPRSLHKDVLNEELFLKLCPTADDIWFWAMAVINKTKIRVIDNNITDLIYINPEREFQMTDGITLYKINQDANDGQLNNLLGFYKEKIYLNMAKHYE